MKYDYYCVDKYFVGVVLKQESLTNVVNWLAHRIARDSKVKKATEWNYFNKAVFYIKPRGTPDETTCND